MNITDKILYITYSNLPKSLIGRLGKSSMLITLRDLFIRDRSGFSKLITKTINYQVSHDKIVSYQLTAPHKIIAKANKSGIENKITRDIYTNCKQHSKGIILDIGANFGTLSLIWAKAMPELEIHSFEAHPKIFQALETSKKNNKLNNLKLYNLAVSSKAGSLSFELRSKTALLKSGKISSAVNIQAESLDSLFAQADRSILAIKIDTDGSDYDVLVGASAILHKFAPLVVIETNQDARIIEFLKGFGYKLFSTDNMPLPDEISDEDLINPLYGNIYAYK